jgi:hypothetical protein
MPTRRVFLLANRSLFAQGVQSLLSGQPGIEVVGIAQVGPEICDQVKDVSPDVVIIEAGLEEQGRLITKLMECVPDAKVIGLTLEDNLLHIYYQQTKEGHGVSDLLDEIQKPLEWQGRRPKVLRLFILFQGNYGERILKNVRHFSPETWTIGAWRAPAALPPVVDAPLDFLPEHLPGADLVLALGESPGAAQLVPSVVERTGARAVIAPVDNVAWLPKGLARQLRAQLMDVGVEAIFPKPFCSLTKQCYNVYRHETTYDDPQIVEFARHFGRPKFQIRCDDRQVTEVEVERDAACGCARSVAHQLVGVDVEEAVLQAGLLHHHYPCLATMRVDPELGEPLIQVSGNFVRRAVERELTSCLSSASTLSE